MVGGYLGAAWRRVRGWLRSPSIPTPVPRHVASVLGRFRRVSVWLSLYRIVLVLVGSGVIFAALASNSVLLSAVASIILFAALVDDVSQAAVDIWNANFWVFEP